MDVEWGFYQAPGPGKSATWPCYHASFFVFEESVVSEPGTLHVVATPIGNLEDLSPRARAVLAAVDRIACEDTRHTGRLLERFGIRATLISLHEHNEEQRIGPLLELLREGRQVALVSDAGTPLMSDPGFPLVRSARAEGIRVSPVPGPCAAVAALAVSGIPPEPFRFLGFPPRRRKARREHFDGLARCTETLVWYESVHRLAASLADLGRAMGGDRDAFVARELTKRHEECRAGTLAELAAWASTNADARRGEAVVVVAGSAVAAEPVAGIDPDRLLRALASRLPPREAAAAAAEVTGGRRNALYQRLMELDRESGD